jgi:hypothetical protein
LTSAFRYPAQNPFGHAAFAQLWDGWQGRRLHVLESRGGRLHYVSRRWGPSCTLDALPFGVPVLAHDADPADRACVEAFFRLSSLRSSLSMLSRPKGTYPKVEWHEQMRSVVTLSEGWQDRVDSDVKRRAARAQKDGWEVAELAPSLWPQVDLAIHSTDRRHGADPRFDAVFFQRLQQLCRGSDSLYLPAAVRSGQLGALNVVAATGGYEVSWFLFATDEARAEGVVPLLWFEWMQQCATRRGEWADLGASPSASVQRFKSSFGAQMVPYYSGTRRWSLFGSG